MADINEGVSKMLMQDLWWRLLLHKIINDPPETPEEYSMPIREKLQAETDQYLEEIQRYTRPEGVEERKKQNRLSERDASMVSPVSGRHYRNPSPHRHELRAGESPQHQHITISEMEPVGRYSATAAAERARIKQEIMRHKARYLQQMVEQKMAGLHVQPSRSPKRMWEIFPYGG